MLLSMTGYGKASSTYKDKKISVEIRTLNGRHTDVRFKIPQNYREKEHVLRKLVLDEAKRGKIEVLVEVVSTGGGDEYGLNEALFKKYYNELQRLSNELNIPQGDIMTAILRIPNIIIAEEGSVSSEEWLVVESTFKEAIQKLMTFRSAEGKALKKDLAERVSAIQTILAQVNPHEEERITNLRTRIRQKLDDYMNKEEIDENRFEQEVLFYLEKIDINEEKVRLAQHCKYFLEQVENKAKVKGKKLGFIGQELGREINTMGAKAYSHSIQKLVVEMKDELEKIKEQVMNVV
ncbi:MAG: YicC/YloC family endoribonuclease [Bacteroidota bacterium]